MLPVSLKTLTWLLDKVYSTDYVSLHFSISVSLYDTVMQTNVFRYVNIAGHSRIESELFIHFAHSRIPSYRYVFVYLYERTFISTSGRF